MALKNTGEALSREAAVMRSLARDIGGLQELGLADLRGRFLAVYGEEARSKNLPYLRKKIAFRIQEQMEGGLSSAAQARVLALSAAETPSEQKRVVKRPPLASAPISAVNPVGRDPRLPKVGSVISREFKGFIHEVKVLEGEFIYRGRCYRSLSAIAKEITGTPWNGFLFFGLAGRGGHNGSQP